MTEELTTQQPPAAAAARRQRVRRAGIVILAAAAADLLVLGTASLAGADLVAAGPPGTEPMRIGVAAVLVSTVAPLLLGGIAHALVGRRWPRMGRVLRWTAVVVAIGSIAAPLGAAHDLATAAALAIMHVVVAAAWLVMTARP